MLKMKRWLTMSKINQYANQIFGDLSRKTIDNFGSLETNIKQGRMGIDPEIYLAKSYFISVITAISTSLLALVFSLLLATFGVLSTTIAIVIPLVFILPLSGILVFSLMIYYPGIEKSSRESSIEKNLPYGITFMYALDKGGLNLVEMFEELAKSEESYGELAVEMQSLINNMEYFGQDHQNALRDLAEETPSDQLREFLQDLVSRLESGAGTTEFLNSKSKESLDKAKENQENFLETLELLSEFYVTIFVATPIFVIVILMAMAMIGAGNIIHIFLVIYGLIPVLSIGFLVLVLTITEDNSVGALQLEEEREKLDYTKAKEEYSEEKYQKEIKNMKESGPIEKILTKPKQTVKEEPILATIYTTPIALAYILLSILLFANPLNILENPITITGIYLVIPAFIIFGPVSIVYEIESRKQNKMIKRLPGILASISKATKVGMNLPQSIHNVEKDTKGRLGEELGKIHNDITINQDVKNALIRFSNRVKNPQISRTIKLIVKANETTGDIGDILEIAGKDIQKRNKLEQQRISTMNSYIAVIVMAFLIYIGIILMLDITFLDAIEEMAQEFEADEEDIDTPDAGQGEAAQAAQGGVGVSPDQLPVGHMKMAFFHSTIIQAITTGLITGYLRTNNLYSGIKIVLFFLMLTTGGFFLFA